ncbi:PadR family transcriptional regulator [Dendronalium sp. ChiSLP03b]|uniref:PadR family transcriptional regulator n=1 Tax=Dendronalium sp. ChiSLP03b TaxID=3075381 RepID=UPI002AD3B37E|nr:PadR family transcriptional regulator [Dendronalium sp. ChiSLP03b]MDZ8208935.1 PadR family transcriptional regulator [Dendronalium sp. ChiSLP03b]
MSLAHTILGFLQQEKMTGYDLKTSCFDRCIAPLWSADQAQIYRTLDKLVDQGWITCTVEIQHDRPNRKVYNMTEAGKAELIRWLQCPQPLPTLREPLIVQLFFAAQLPNEAIVQLLEQQLTARNEKLAKCKNVELPMLGDRFTSREQMMQKLVLDLVIRREQTYIDWLMTAIDVIRHQRDGETGEMGE